MHDLASNTELDSENHKMKVVLTPKFRHLSPKRKNIETRKQTTRGDQKVRGKVLLNRIAFIDFNENSYT